MEHKKRILLISVLSLLFGGIGLFLVYSPLWDWCEASSFCETSFLDEGIAQPLILFSLAIFPLSLLLNFFKEEIFYLWSRFAKWYLIVSAAILILGSNEYGGYVSGGLNDRESMTWFLAGLFFVTSLVLIAYKFFTLKKNGAGK